MKNWYCNNFGWKTLKDENGIVFFKLNGIILGLYPAAELAEDIGISENGSGFKRFSMAINCFSEEEVDEQFEILRKKNVNVVREPEKVFWGGYRGYVSDPEENYWEIAYNPFLKMDANGNVVAHS